MLWRLDVLRCDMWLSALANAARLLPPLPHRRAGPLVSQPRAGDDEYRGG